MSKVWGGCPPKPWQVVVLSVEVVVILVLLVAILLQVRENLARAAEEAKYTWAHPDDIPERMTDVNPVQVVDLTHPVADADSGLLKVWANSPPPLEDDDGILRIQNEVRDQP